MDINWWLSIFVGTILAFPVSILANLLTPKFQDFLARRSISTRHKRLNTLKKEYAETQELHQDPHKMYLTIIDRGLVIGTFSLIGFGLILLPFVYALFEIDTRHNLVVMDLIEEFGKLIGRVGSIIGAVILLPVMILLDKLHTLVMRLSNYAEYEKSVLEKLTELENL